MLHAMESWGVPKASCVFFPRLSLYVAPSAGFIPHLCSLPPQPKSLSLSFIRLLCIHQSACAIHILLGTLQRLSCASLAELRGNCWLLSIPSACTSPPLLCILLPLLVASLAIPEHTRFSVLPMGLCTCHSSDLILIQAFPTSSVKFSIYGQAELGVFSPFCSYGN